MIYPSLCTKSIVAILVLTLSYSSWFCFGFSTRFNPDIECSTSFPGASPSQPTIFFEPLRSSSQSIVTHLDYAGVNDFCFNVRLFRKFSWVQYFFFDNSSRLYYVTLFNSCEMGDPSDANINIFFDGLLTSPTSGLPSVFYPFPKIDDAVIESERPDWSGISFVDGIQQASAVFAFSTKANFSDGVAWGPFSPPPPNHTFCVDIRPPSNLRPDFSSTMDLKFGFVVNLRPNGTDNYNRSSDLISNLEYIPFNISFVYRMRTCCSYRLFVTPPPPPPKCVGIWGCYYIIILSVVSSTILAVLLYVLIWYLCKRAKLRRQKKRNEIARRTPNMMGSLSFETQLVFADLSKSKKHSKNLELQLGVIREPEIDLEINSKNLSPFVQGMKRELKTKHREKVESLNSFNRGFRFFAEQAAEEHRLRNIEQLHVARSLVHVAEQMRTSRQQNARFAGDVEVGNASDPQLRQYLPSARKETSADSPIRQSHEKYAPSPSSSSSSPVELSRTPSRPALMRTTSKFAMAMAMRDEQRRMDSLADDTGSVSVGDDTPSFTSAHANGTSSIQNSSSS